MVHFFSIRRLRQLLSCFNVNETIIIGERYGYGFHPNGQRGYDYPTGGSGYSDEICVIAH